MLKLFYMSAALSYETSRIFVINKLYGQAKMVIAIGKNTFRTTAITTANQTAQCGRSCCSVILPIFTWLGFKRDKRWFLRTCRFENSHWQSVMLLWIFAGNQCNLSNKVNPFRFLDWETEGKLSVTSDALGVREFWCGINVFSFQ